MKEFTFIHFNFIIFIIIMKVNKTILNKTQSLNKVSEVTDFLPRNFLKNS